MKSDFARLVFAIAAIAAACAAEELLPKFFGAGVPVLLAVALYAAVNGPLARAAAFAIVAGAAEDSISSLPAATSMSYFALAAIATRLSGRASAALLAFPAYQFWLWLWNPQIGAGLVSRAFAAMPAGLCALLSVRALLDAVKRKAALDV